MSAIRDRSILIACIGAGSAIAAALIKPVCESLMPDKPAPQAAVVVTTGPGGVSLSDGVPITPTPNNIEGSWKQYILTQDEGAVYLGTFVVGKSRGEYVISARSQNEGKFNDHLEFQTSIGVFDVAYDGKKWTFNSNWGNDEVGNFELDRISPTIFEGEIRVAGKLSNRTRMVKIE